MSGGFCEFQIFFLLISISGLIKANTHCYSVATYIKIMFDIPNTKVYAY